MDIEIIHKWLKVLGIYVNKKRVARFMSEAKLFGVEIYKRKQRYKVGALHKSYKNHLKQCFITEKPNDSWVNDITYIRTHEGCLYLAIILNLYSRKIVGWASSHRINTYLVLRALENSIYRIENNNEIVLHLKESL